MSLSTDTAAALQRPRPRRAVLVVCDSLRADLISPQRTPHLARLRDEGTWFGAHRSVFPSTTRTASASLATGCLPRSHGMHGNRVALDEGAGLVVLSTGGADFVPRWRAASGATLHRPTLAQRLAAHGGVEIYSNASAGAAMLQDPDGYGTLFNRSGSHLPGGRPAGPGRHLDVPKGTAGDTATTERFCAEALRADGPALAVMWVSEPDNTGHKVALGSPEHDAVLAATDACVGQVWARLQALGAGSNGLLMLVTADHGHETTHRTIDVEQALVDAGLKAALDSRDLVAASQGSAALLYLAPEAWSRREALLVWLEQQDWVQSLHWGPGLEAVGLPDTAPLAVAVDMKKHDGTNAHGIPGFSDIMLDRGDAARFDGFGQHGGFGQHEQGPFLMALGGGFAPGTRIGTPSSPIDLAPTILRHLGLLADGMDGTALPQHP